MASFIGVTPGTGVKVAASNTYTESGNVVLDQKVIEGEQYLGGYTFGGGAGSGSYILTNANSHLLEIMAGSSLNVRVRRIELYQSQLAAAASFTIFQLVRLTSAGTGGTVITPALLDMSDSPAGCTGMRLPSSLGTEGPVVWECSVTLASALPTNNTIGPLVAVDFTRLIKPIIIPVGVAQGLALKNTAAVGSAAIIPIIYVTETSF